RPFQNGDHLVILCNGLRFDYITCILCEQIVDVVMDGVFGRRRCDGTVKPAGLLPDNPPVLCRMGGNIEAPLATAEAQPVHNHEEPLLSQFHYNSIAYAIVIGAYVLAFAEYLYLRLTSLIFPEKVVYHSVCEKRSSEVVGKNALNYAIIIVAFCFVALFQIICFFGLTISEKWTICIPSDGDPTAQKKQALANRIRNTMNTTVYPTFICYIISSVIVSGVIFYVIGVRDSVDEITSSISLYSFDVVLLIYFLAFPVIVYIYHPFLRRRSTFKIS
ncbi:unnamed protein product, partial [Toxocara canis]|uniref:G_PROTEIN_RECEP_F1_2 domain-containing protein n=1 Tax=Toxocara canis TaxID=6265 RepID=A0A183UW09_TOXCA